MRLAILTLIVAALAGATVLFGESDPVDRAPATRERAGSQDEVVEAPSVPRQLPAHVIWARKDPLLANLEMLLRRIARTAPRQRGPVVRDLTARIDDLRGHLLALLEDPEAKLLLPAIIAAGLVRLHDADHLLRTHLSHSRPEIRAASLRALGQLGQLRGHRIARILGAEKPEVLIAALDTATRMDDPPAEAIIPHLRHSNERVRMGAVNAVPVELQQEELDELCEIARSGDGPAIKSMLGVLGVVAETPQRESCLLGLLASDDWTVRRESLRALARGEKTLGDTEPVWKILERADTFVHEKLAGFLALERTRSFDTARTRKAIPELHPVPRIYAARCLVAAGDPFGLVTLVDLLETEEGPGVDDEDVDCARDSALELLREVSGEDLDSPAAWRSWALAQRKLQTRSLTSRPRFFW